MSAPIAKSDLTFELPNLSYIHAHLEEPNLRAISRPESRRGIAGWLAGRIVAFREWRLRQEALAELEMMTDRELMDIGLNRGDLGRIFQPVFNQDLMQRGCH